MGVIKIYQEVSVFLVWVVVLAVNGIDSTGYTSSQNLSQPNGSEDYNLQISASQVMVERDTGRPRGFGFLTFADRHAMEDAIREMDGRELGDRVISVNKAQPKMAGEDSDRGYDGGGYSSGGRGRGSYGGGDRSAGQGSCFKCGRPGHWARDCPSEGGGRSSARAASPPPRSRYVGGGARGDRYGSDHRDMDDQYDRGHYADREQRYDSREDRYGSRDRYANDRYPPSGDRFAGNRYGASDRYPQSSYGKERGFDRDIAPRGSDRDIGPRGGDRYSSGGPAARHEGRSFRDVLRGGDRAGPYDRPRRGGRPPAFDRY